MLHGINKSQISKMYSMSSLKMAKNGQNT